MTRLARIRAAYDNAKSHQMYLFGKNPDVGVLLPIVEQLASMEKAPIDPCGNCYLCGKEIQFEYDGEFWRRREVLDDHDPSCGWRMAKELDLDEGQTL